MIEDLTPMSFRVEPSLRKAFLDAAARQHRNGSQLLRDFMRQYVTDNAQQDLFVAKKKVRG